MTDRDDLVLEPLGECALRFALPAHTDARALLDALRATAGVRDAVVTESHACIVFDDAPPDPRPAIAAARSARFTHAVREHRVVVRYDGADLAEFSARTGLSRAAVIAAHSAVIYIVRFVGFMPGFAYLGDVDQRLQLPRRSEPRTRVPAGAVAIAGTRTGVYPFASPGGWHLLGTAVDFAAFDPARGATLALGDRVRFEAVE